MLWDLLPGGPQLGGAPTNFAYQAQRLGASAQVLTRIGKDQTVASGSLTSLPANLTHFDAPLDALGILRTDSPHYYRDSKPGESETEFVDRITNNLEKLIEREGADTIAAFIAEPITGASGVIVPPDGYYKKVQAILNKHNILFWADEVINGFGRTGNDFGCTTMKIQQPDMMSLAKQLSSGYVPISAAVIKGDMYEAMVEPSNQVGVFGHGYTYSGHPLACAVALKTLEIYQRGDICEKASIRLVDNNEADEAAKGAGEILCWQDHPSGVPYIMKAPDWARIGEEQSWKRLSPAPRHGKHTREVLEQLGYSAQEIEGLISLGVAHEYIPAMTDKDDYFFTPPKGLKKAPATSPDLLKRDIK